MFDVPIRLPTGTNYNAIGVGPEATAQEISDSIHQKKTAIKVRRELSLRRQRQVDAAVPDLSKVQKELETLEAQEGDRGEIHKLRQAIAELESEAEKHDPEFRSIHAELVACDQDEEALNRLQLQSDSERRIYDLANPPFAIMKLAPPAQDQFATDPAHMLSAVRQDLIEFLLGKGEEIYHPTDLTRTDFESDFHYLELLDGSP